MTITELDLTTVKNYLRVDHNLDDAIIQMMIDSAKTYVQNFLNRSFEDFEQVPTEFVIAALNLIASWYEQRAIQSEGQAREQLYSFSDLLLPHRKFLGES